MDCSAVVANLNPYPAATTLTLTLNPDPEPEPDLDPVVRARYEAFFDHPPEAAQYAARGAAALEALTPAPSMLAKHASLQLTVIPLAESPGGTARCEHGAVQ